MSPIRLQVAIAHGGVASRRKAEELIEQGQVQVNGHTVTELGTKVEPGKDTITVQGRVVPHIPQQLEYYLLYKPVGVLSTAHDDRHRPAVIQLVPSKQRLYPVGRLDKNSEGLILLTNDGTLTQLVTHPRYHVAKTYQVEVRGTVTSAALDQWRKGGQVIDGKPVHPTTVTLKKSTLQSTWLEITLYEGRKRQIREVAKQLGLRVGQLIRTAFGPLHISNLKSGQWRALTPREVLQLRQSATQHTITHGSSSTGNKSVPPRRSSK